MNRLVRNQILIGDVRERLGDLPDSSIDCVITSVPYYQLRDYGVEGQIGLEDTVQQWLNELRVALNALSRVLKPTGSLWLNIGDSYSRHIKFGAPPKGLLLAPERLLIALATDGWIVRNKVIWAKTNPMPHAVADRLSNSYDHVYFLTRSPHYFFDLDAIRLPYRAEGAEPAALTCLLGKNPGDVWPIAVANYHGAHFATFPPSLVERPLLATCPELICTRCDTPFARSIKVRGRPSNRGQRSGVRDPHVRRYSDHYNVIRERGELQAACQCGVSPRPGVVLDPFFGAGTVGLVAEANGRDWLGIEISPDYAELARRRIARAGERAIDERRAA